MYLITKNNIINLKLIFSILICLTCVIGDYLVELSARKSSARLFQAIYDNLTHGFIGLFCAIIIIHEFKECLRYENYEHILLIAVCAGVSSFIDIDHFIAAKSFSLHDATNLKTRPFLHCSNIPFAIMLLLLVGTYFKSERLNIWLAIIFCGFISHHVRDATRRGFWILPYGHTKAIPYTFYVILTVAIPHLLIYLLNSIKHENNIKYKLVINV